MNQLFSLVGACSWGEVLWFPIGQVLLHMSNNPSRPILQKPVLWELLSSPHGFRATGTCWWSHLCQQLYLLQAPGPLPMPGSCHLFCSPPSYVLVWHWTGHAMCSCSFRDSLNWSQAGVHPQGFPQQTWTFAAMALWWHLEKPTAVPWGQIHQKHSACSLFLLIEWTGEFG